VLVISGTDRRRRAMRVMMMAVMEVRQHLHPKILRAKVESGQQLSGGDRTVFQISSIRMSNS
jgi:hypothetical protein